MRLLYLKLVNFIGIYNGMGINTIEIDFSKCTHNITIIHGINGSGKSTLFNALNPFSDPSDALIPNSEASKEIHYLMDNGDIIKIQYKYENKKIRKSSCHVYKVDPSGEVDLVPNGNIKDAKEMISTIFDFDPNFLGLSQLSSTNRGLADMRPADRKKFITSIMENLTAYNEIYKKLMKKSNALKSMITNINNKISSIGNTDQIQNHISTLEDQLGSSEDRKNLLIAQIADIKAKVGNIDINSVISQMKKYDGRLKNLPNIKTDIGDYNDSDYERDKDKIIELNSNISKFKSSIDILNKVITDDKDKVQTYYIKNESIQDKDKLNDFINKKKKYEDNLKWIIDKFNKSGFTAYNYIDDDKFTYLMNQISYLNQISSSVRLDDNYTENEYDLVLNCLNEKSDPYFLNETNTNIYKLQSILDSLNNKIENRSKIKINLHCNEAMREHCPVLKEFIGIESDEEINEEKKNLEKEIEEVKKVDRLKNLYNKILPDFKSYTTRIDANFNLFASIGIDIDHIHFGTNIDIPYDGKYNDIKNYLTSYKNLKSEIEKVNEQIEVMQNKVSSYNSIQTIIDELDQRVKENYQKRSDLQKDLDMDTETRNYILDKMNAYSVWKNRKDLEDKMNALKSDYDLASSVDKEVNIKMEELKDLNMNIIPHIQDEIAKCKYQLVLYEEYVKDYKDFTNKFNMVELFKKYSSPTTGIQTVFMQMYMNDIIDISNRLLGMLFNGEYVLYPFVINETEFRIPCCGNGLMNDDISSMSASQIAMISMIISFALLHKSSSTYNIVKLDEVDGALDTNNRMQFIVLLQKMMDMLRYNQCIMISHNSEINTANVDLILLKHDSNEELTGNIVYDYNRGY